MPEQHNLVGGRYCLKEQIGAGGASVVWRALDLELNRDVAVKLLSANQSAEQKARIWREARLAAVLGKHGAVPLYDFGDDGTHTFLVMELVKEPTLRIWMEKGKEYSLSTWVEIALKLLQILQKAHSLSLIHRDLKPENIFVAGSPEKIGRVRLVDFGLAFVQKADAGSLGRLTDANSVIGTPAYLSPEQANGAPLFESSDIYSLGCVFYEMICGFPPFIGSISEIVSKHIYVPPIALVERDDKVPSFLSDIVLQMLEKEPSDRPKAETLVPLLQKWLEEGDKNIRRTSHVEAREKRMVASGKKSKAYASGDLPVEVQVCGALNPLVLKGLAEAGISLVESKKESSVLCLLWVDSLADLEPPLEGAAPTLALIHRSLLSDLSVLLQYRLEDAIAQDESIENILAKVARLHRRILKRKTHSSDKENADPTI